MLLSEPYESLKLLNEADYHVLACQSSLALAINEAHQFEDLMLARTNHNKAKEVAEQLTERAIYKTPNFAKILTFDSNFPLFEDLKLHFLEGPRKSGIKAGPAIWKDALQRLDELEEACRARQLCEARYAKTCSRASTQRPLAHCVLSPIFVLKGASWQRVSARPYRGSSLPEERQLVALQQDRLSAELALAYHTLARANLDLKISHDEARLQEYRKSGRPHINAATSSRQQLERRQGERPARVQSQAAALKALRVARKVETDYMKMIEGKPAAKICQILAAEQQRQVRGARSEHAAVEVHQAVSERSSESSICSAAPRATARS